MKLFITLLSLFVVATPAQAITWGEFWDPFTDGGTYYRPRPRRYYEPRYYTPRRTYGETEYCTKYTYREEYVPGDIHRPGYVRRVRDSYRVPCY